MRFKTLSFFLAQSHLTDLDLFRHDCFPLPYPEIHHSGAGCSFSGSSGTLPSDPPPVTPLPDPDRHFFVNPPIRTPKITPEKNIIAVNKLMISYFKIYISKNSTEKLFGLTSVTVPLPLLKDPPVSSASMDPLAPIPLLSILILIYTVSP